MRILLLVHGFNSLSHLQPGAPYCAKGDMPKEGHGTGMMERFTITRSLRQLPGISLPGAGKASPAPWNRR